MERMFDEVQFKRFPATRYMGSKSKIIHIIGGIMLEDEFSSFLDLFSGTNIVSYFMKCAQKDVIANDFMLMNSLTGKALIENNKETVTAQEIDFLIGNKNNYSFIEDRFAGLYFSPDDNAFIQRVRYNAELLPNEYKRSIAVVGFPKNCLI